MEFWFLSFLWQRDDATFWRPVETVAQDEHPLDYMARMRQANPTHAFVLVSFQQIPPDVYWRMVEHK